MNVRPLSEITLVQHSGYGYANKPAFKRAVETRFVHTERERNRVIKAGGVLVRSNRHISDIEHMVNYPKDVEGLIPRCRGTFSIKEIDGLRIYQPTNEERAEIDAKICVAVGS